MSEAAVNINLQELKKAVVCGLLRWRGSVKHEEPASPKNSMWGQKQTKERKALVGIQRYKNKKLKNTTQTQLSATFQF